MPVDLTGLHHLSSVPRAGSGERHRALGAHRAEPKRWHAGIFDRVDHLFGSVDQAGGAAPCARSSSSSRCRRSPLNSSRPQTAPPPRNSKSAYMLLFSPLLGSLLSFLSSPLPPPTPQLQVGIPAHTEHSGAGMLIGGFGEKTCAGDRVEQAGAVAGRGQRHHQRPVGYQHLGERSRGVSNRLETLRSRSINASPRVFALRFHCLRGQDTVLSCTSTVSRA